MMKNFFFWFFLSVLLHLAAVAGIYSAQYFSQEQSLQNDSSTQNTLTIYVNQKVEAKASAQSPAPMQSAPTAGGLGSEGFKPLIAIIPLYPEVSRSRGEEGVVEVEFFVEKDGVVSRVEIVRGSGYYRLDESVREALNKARFAEIPEARSGNKLRFVFELELVQ